jgi:thiol-disulfide isomerase/thioredoxin
VIDRRALLAAALATPVAANAQAPANLTFGAGPLSQNPVARRFRKFPDPAQWPPKPFLDSAGERPLSAFKGKVVLMSLWSEACAPCLVELPIFAALNAKYGGPNFQIVPVVTGPSRLDTAARAQKFLNDRKIPISTLMDGGKDREELMGTLASSRRDPNGALPCNVLIDKDGRIRGRQTGFVVTLPAGAPPPKDGEDLKNMKSVWETADAEAFFTGLLAGALD